jgi:hypothetical protein
VWLPVIGEGVGETGGRVRGRDRLQVTVWESGR